MCPGAACRGSGLCRVGVLPEVGVGVPDGGDLRAGVCAGTGLQGLAAVCPGGGLPRHTGRLFPGRKKVFPAKIFPHAMYKEARGAGLRKLVDKAIFSPIVWWV